MTDAILRYKSQPKAMLGTLKVHQETGPNNDFWKEQQYSGMSHIVDPNFPNSKINKSEFPIPISLEIPVHCNHNPPMQASSLDPELDDLRFFSFLSFLLFLLFFLLLSFFSGFLVLMVSV